MASLVFYVINVGNEFYKVAKIFITSRGSFDLCIDYILTKRYNYLLEKRANELKLEQKQLSSEDDVLLPRLHRRFSALPFGFDTPDSCRRIVRESIEIMSDPDVVFTNDKLSKIIPGRSFLIKGITLRTCERFSINFVVNHPTKDIALHFNPRLPQNYIVRNCKINGSWGTEEVTSPLKFSLFRGQPFAIQFLVTDNEFYISINGRHFASFRHRLPYDLINIMQVKGDVSDITMVESTVEDYPDSLDFRPQIIQSLASETEIHERDSFNFGEYLEMPYYGKLELEFLTGCEINIEGRVKLLPHSFYINLQEGIQIWPHPGIPFHFNPRFANIGGKHVIVRNSWYNGKWDREEVTQVTTDFFPGKEFLLTIRSNETSYSVYLNKKLIADYPFRTTQYNVNTVYIQGDIHLYNVWMKNVDSVSVLMFNTNFNKSEDEYVLVDRAI